MVDDASTDGSADFLCRPKAAARLLRTRGVGVAAARNRGARESRGQVIVYADAHMSLPRGWWQPLLDLVAAPRAGAAAPVIVDEEEPRRKGYGLRLTGPDITADWLRPNGKEPYTVPILPGCCLAMRRDVFDETGGFDGDMLRSGGVDNELGIRFWLLGYEMWLAPRVEARHLFRERPPYPVAWRYQLHNRLRLAFLHLNRRRAAKAVETLRGHTGFGDAMTLIEQDDLPTRRAELRARRVYDDDWFFGRFGGSW